MLTTHVIAHSFSGPSIYNNREAFFFEVEGLPKGEEAQIRKSYQQWQTRRATSMFWSEWSGEFASTEEALASLATESKHFESSQ